MAKLGLFHPDSRAASATSRASASLGPRPDERPGRSGVAPDVPDVCVLELIVVLLTSLDPHRAPRP